MGAFGLILWAWARPLLIRFGIYIAIAGAVVASYLYVDVRAYHRGWGAAIAKIEKANAGAEKGARDALENLKRECARDPDGCLRDGWTRND